MVIELLEGKPPYHFLDPMPALFRIVQDDCPPIPEGCSPIVKDFLYHCFQKDVNLRVSAKKLLRHPWMVSARKQMGLSPVIDKKGKDGGVNENDTARRSSNYGYDEAVLKVQEWNEALKCMLFEIDLIYIFFLSIVTIAPTRPSKPAPRKSFQNDGRHSPTPSAPSIIQPSSPTLTPSNSSQQTMTPSKWKSSTAPTKPTYAISGMNGPLGFIEKSREPLPMVLQEPEDETDNWDDDFEEGISLTKLQGLDRSFEEDKPEIDDNARTIRPHRSPSLSKHPVASAPSANMTPIVEDYSDLAGDEDDVFQGKVADFKLKNSAKRGLFHPKDIKTVGLMPSEPAPQSAPLSETTPIPSRSGISPISRVPSSSRSHSRSNSVAGSLGRAEAARVIQNQEFDKYAEEPDEDYEDVFGKSTGPGTLSHC